MPRFSDAVIPVVVGERPPRPPGWHADVVVAIERAPVYAWAWDDYEALWDGTEPAPVWDDETAGAGFIDATCDLQGVEIEVGNPDTEGAMDAGHLMLTLANADGQWSQYDLFGRLVAYEPGSRVVVYCDLDSPGGGTTPWWLFSGYVTAWRERADATVEVEAFDASSRLNQGVPGPWVPGSVGDKPEQRLAAIVAMAGYTEPTRFDVGTVTLAAPETTNTPLEEMQATAASDGGFVGVDSDGTLVYRNRAWAGGRTDQYEIRRFSDNVCTVPAIVREPVLATDDEMTVTDAYLENVEGVTAEAHHQGAIRRFTLRRAGDLWREAFEGTDLAATLVAQRAGQYLRIAGFTLLLTDPLQDLWIPGVDLRVGDLIRFIHDQPAVGGIARLDLNLVVQAIRHAITPSEWRVDVATTRAVGNNITFRWNWIWRWDTPPVVWTN